MPTLSEIQSAIAGTEFRIHVSRTSMNVITRSVGEVTLYGPSPAYPGERRQKCATPLFEGDEINASGYRAIMSHISAG